MRDTWSLDVLYTGFDDKRWSEDLKKLDDCVERFQAFAAKLSDENEKETIKEGLKLLEELEGLSAQMMIFCELRGAADTRDKDSMSYEGVLSQKRNRTRAAETKFAEYVATRKNLEQDIKEDAFLTSYAYLLRNMAEDNRHLLAGDVEEALAKMDISGGAAWSSLQGYLTSSVEADLGGKKLTLSEVRNLAYSPSREERKAAYEAELACYDKIKDSVAYALNSIKMQDISECELRGFASPLAKTLYYARMKEETLNALLEAMTEYMPQFWRYLRLKAEKLGYADGLPWYELFAPLGKSTKRYTTEEARDYLITVFSSFSPDMAEMMKRAFAEDWIDFYPRNGKVGGAFCEALNSKKEFRVLTNFSGSFSDLVTLAHALEHGRQPQGMHEAGRVLRGKQIAQHILRGSALAGGQDGAALEVCHAVDGVALLHHIQNAQSVHRHGLNAAAGFLVQSRSQIGRDSSHVQLALDEQRHDLIRSAVKLQIVVHGGGTGLLHREQVDKSHGGGALQPGNAQRLGGRQRRCGLFLRSSRRGSSFGHRCAGNGRACAAAAGCKAQCKAERQQ